MKQLIGGDKKGSLSTSGTATTAGAFVNTDKNFDFTLSNGQRLEEIREQLKEESNIIDEWDQHKGAGNIKGTAISKQDEKTIKASGFSHSNTPTADGPKEGAG